MSYVQHCYREREARQLVGKFAFEFFGQVVKQSDADENVFLAPTTFAAALSMILLGAHGDTKN